MKKRLYFLLGVLVQVSFATAQTHFTFTSNTGNNATVAVPVSANPNINGTPLSAGDEIGVFTPAALCVGAVVWQGTNTAITVWGDNEQTPEIDGIRVGEQIHYRVWRQSTNTEYSNVSVTYSEGNGIYAVNGIYVLSSLTAVGGAQTHFTFTSNTGNNATVAVPTSANPNINGTPLSVGDEIGVFTPAGLCVGAVVWQGTNTAITVWGDNDQTPEIDGIRVGEQIRYRVWQVSTNIEYSNVTVTYSQGNGIYAVDGIYVLSSLSASLAAPTLASPVNGAINQPTTLTLRWNAVPGATNYHLQVATDSSFTTPIVNDSTLTDTLRQTGPLANLTRYYWRVRAKNIGGVSDWSSVWSFITVSLVPVSGQTIFTGYVALDSSYAPPGTVLRAYRKLTGALVDTAIVVPFNQGKNYALSILQGDGGVQGGDTIIFRVFASGTEVPLRYCPGGEAAIFDSAFPPAIKEFNIKAAHERSLVLPVVQGYNALSWNVKPQNDSVRSVFASLLATGKVQIILDYLNNGITPPQFTFYIPELGQYNPFQVTDIRKGHFVRLRSNMTPDSAVVNGLPVCNDIPIPLRVGYNFASYFPERRDSIIHALGSLDWNNVSTVLDYVNTGTGLPGSEYFEPYPQGGVFMVMGEGKGYFVRLNQGLDTIIYPALFEPTGAMLAGLLPGNGEKMSLTGGGLPVAVFAYGTAVTFQGQLVPGGSIIRAIDRDGILCGQATFAADGVVGLAIRGDDPSTPEDEGAETGEWVSLYLNQVLVPARVQWTGFGDTPVLEDLSITAVGDADGIPTTFALSQNYPNPFNPTTEIRFQVPINTRVIIKVYNILGAEVKTLVDEEKMTGYHRVMWDGRNELGRPVASGLYFYRMVAGGFSKVHRMLLLK